MRLFKTSKNVDPARVPPGQYVTERFPVLHAGVTPKIDLETWTFDIGGLVTEPKTMILDEIKGLGPLTMTSDIHCVTKWSKLDTRWRGVPTKAVLDQVEVSDEATHVLVRAEHGFTANLPIEDFLADDAMFAWEFDDKPLDLEHGWPLRLVVPHLYFWKSVKWVRGLTLMAADQPGFWERNGYHMYGDPWKEQRYWGD